MSKYEKPVQQEDCMLSDEELKFFYKEVLLYYENDKFDKRAFGRFDDFKRKLSKNERLKFFSFEFEDYLEKMKEAKMDTFYFHANKDDGDKDNSNIKHTKILKKWFGHIRNAFVHNHIFREDDGSLILRSFDSKSYKPLLYVKLTSFNDFVDLFKFVKSYVESNIKKVDNIEAICEDKLQ